MNITLRKIKIVERLSEETQCYTAEVLLDGVKVADASNRGTGGCDDIYFKDQKVRKQIEDYAKTLPPVPNPYDAANPFPNSLEWIISDLLEKHAAEKHEAKVLAQKKRWCKDSTMFRLKGDKAGSYRGVKHVFTPAVKAHLVKTYGEKLEEILNETLPA